MRFLLFYSMYEWKRKPLRLLAMGIATGIPVFCMTVLTLLLAVNHMAVTQTTPQTPLFLSANFLLLLATHAILLLLAAALLTGIKLQQDAREYSILQDLGVHKRKLVLLQCILNSLLFLLAGAIAVPAALGLMRIFVKTVNQRVNQSVFAWTVPTIALSASVFLLFLILWLGTAIPFLILQHTETYKAEGIFDNRYPPAKMFRVIQRRRSGAKNHTLLLLLAALQTLPLIFLIAAMSFSPVAEPLYDCSVSMHDDNRILITEEIIQDIRSLDGITALDAREETIRGTAGYSYVRIKFADQAREASLQAIHTMSALAPYTVLDQFHAAQTASLKNAACRNLFLLLALIMLPVSLGLYCIISFTAWEKNNESMTILHTLGLPCQDIHNCYRKESIRQSLWSTVWAGLTAGTLYAIMEAEGGGSFPLPKILTVMGIALIVQLMLSLFIAHLAYLRLLRNHLHAEKNRKEKKDAYLL